MNLILIGMNHKTAPLDLRERLSISCEGATHPLREIMKIPKLDGVIYLSTCNRVEVLAQTTDTRETVERLQDFILQHGNLSREELVRCLYVCEDQEAVRHLFRVTSSLDSLVMGEPQILGQVKDAYRQAVDNGTTGIILNKIMHYAFRVAKRVRTETGLAANAVSVSFAAVELSKKIFGGLQGKTVLLVGAGEMSELAARHLINYGAAQILIANRTPARAQQMAEEFHGRSVPLDQIEETLRDVDIVISSTGATGYMITAGMVAAALRRRKNRLLFLIDIAVPRDIDPAAGEIENVFLYNIDNLQDIVDENVRGRMQEAQKAEVIINEEVSRFTRWYNTLAVVPTIVSLKEKADGILRGEIDRSSAWMQRLTEEDRNNIEILAGAIVNKILHELGPLELLGQHAGEQDAQAADGCGGEHHRHDGEPYEAAGLQPQPSGDGGAGQEGDRHRVQRREERAEPPVDDAGCEEQLEGVGRDAEQVQHERDGRVQAAEEGQEPREGQARVVRQPHRHVREPAGEQDEAERQELAGVREVERGRHDDVRQPGRLVIGQLMA